MTVLVIDNEARAAAKRVIEYAEANPYLPPYKLTPGDNPKYVAQFGPYRVVFTITHAGPKIFRHISMSLPKNFPHPAAVLTICDLFGFTGWDRETISFPAGWQVALNDKEGCIIVAQEKRHDH